MGLYEFFNKPNPQVVTAKLTEALTKSQSLTQQGDKKKALATLLEFKNWGWDHANYVLNMGMAYYSLAQIPEAIECFERAIELGPQYGISHMHLGRALFEARRYDEAAAAYTKAMQLIEADPQKNNYAQNHPVACAWYGACLAMTGKKEEAETYFKKAEAEGYQNGKALRQVVGLPLPTAQNASAPKAPAISSAQPDTPKMRELYQKLANIIWDAIPEEWSIVYFYGEVLSDSRTAYFFYKRVSDGELIYSHDIPSKCNVAKSAYTRQLSNIWDCLAELNQEHAANYDKVWTNLTMILESNGKFNMKYNYDDVLNCGFRSYERIMIWQYEVMGIEPKDEKDKEVLRRYLEGKK